MKKTPQKLNAERQRQVFDKEFKLQAVQMLRQGLKPASELACELGIARNQLHKWDLQLRTAENEPKKVFNGPGRPPEAELNENQRLKRELARVTEERDILKKAAAYFAKQLP